MYNQIKEKMIINQERYLVKCKKICIALFVALLVYQLLCQPIIGIANNGDFWRLSAAVGLEPILEEHDTYMVDTYRYIDEVDTGFYSSYEVIIRLAKILSRIFGKRMVFQIQFISVIDIILFGILYVAFIILLKKARTSAQIYFMIATMIIFTDQYVVQYVNSFYSEIGGVIYSITFLLAAIEELQTDDINKKKKLWALMCFAIVLFGLAKKQYMLSCVLYFIFAGSELYRIWKKDRHKRYLLFFLAMIGFFIFGYLENGAGGHMTVYNEFMVRILPSADNPLEVLEFMGFDEKEQEKLKPYIGHQIWETDSMNRYYEYENDFSRINEMKVLIKFPEIIPKLLKMGSNSLFQDVSYLGNFTENSGLTYQKSQACRIWSLCKNKIYRNSLCFYAGVLSIALLLGIYSYLRSKQRLSKLLIFCIFSNVAHFMTVIFADGSEWEKHFFSSI